jgi:hypothetical protein
MRGQGSGVCDTVNIIGRKGNGPRSRGQQSGQVNGRETESDQ